MRFLTRIHTARLVRQVAPTALTLAATIAPSTARAHGQHGDPGAVFVRTNDISGNAILAYARAADRTLTAGQPLPTSGRGAPSRARPPIRSPRRAR